ncbi:MAG TPA: aldehyde dehydrogenase family protein [Ktedonobacterales bacterium]|jgi:acyl-CoA reductase-like NAD-dependent aldehyde dehydrogenase|nr:aldehyde dehydrogenase family protein [Ktedonobacterales bacterium]
MTTILDKGSFQFPTASDARAASDQAMMDAAIQTLQERKDAWVNISTRERIALIDRLISDFHAIQERWVAACLEAKGLAPDAPAAGEEWATGAYATLKHLRQLRTSLSEIERHGAPRIPGPVRTLPNGQVVAQVFPQTLYDQVFYSGVTAEVWQQPDVTVERLPQTMAVSYRNKSAGRVALVLGAGNVSSIGPMDALYKLFVENQVVALKTNPVNAYLGPLIEEAFRSLIDAGYLRILYGSAAEGAYLCNHSGVDEIHITGSDKTFDAIVWGVGSEAAARKAARTPLLTKRITGELGNVSPVIVVPGPWSASDISYHAAHIASMLTNNAGYNCNATRVIIQHDGWAQREPLLHAVRDIFRNTPARPAYYPGSHQRYAAFTEAHPEAERFGEAHDGVLPWTLITGVDPQASDDICFTTEAFCALFAETTLAAGSVAEYIDHAVAFCNEQVWGTLSATLLVHPASLKDPAVAQAVERAIATLRYGSIGVNYWGGVSFALGVTTWGAFPGHALDDIRSGNGVVHNALMFDQPQKSVIRAKFRLAPTPPWFVTRGKVASSVFRQLADLEAQPSLTHVPGIALAAFG